MCQKYSPCVFKVLRLCSYFFREEADRDPAGKATGKATGEVIGLKERLLQSYCPAGKDKLFESYGVTNKPRESASHTCRRNILVS